MAEVARPTARPRSRRTAWRRPRWSCRRPPPAPLLRLRQQQGQPRRISYGGLETATPGTVNISPSCGRARPPPPTSRWPPSPTGPTPIRIAPSSAPLPADAAALRCSKPWAARRPAWNAAVEGVPGADDQLGSVAGEAKVHRPAAGARTGRGCPARWRAPYEFDRGPLKKSCSRQALGQSGSGKMLPQPPQPDRLPARH